MATADPSIFDQLLQKLIGSSTTTNEDAQLGVNNAITQGQTSQQGTTQNVSGNTSQTTSTNADTTDLAKVFQQQQAGITPEMLKSIFVEGAKQAPGLVTANANAVGARSGSNSPEALSLQTLDSNLTSLAAQINQQLLNSSGQTAGQIADLTKSSTTSGQTQQGTTANVTGTQNTNTQQNQISTKADDTTTRQTINAKSSGLTAGAALLASLLKSGGGSIPGLSDIIGKLFGGAAGGVAGNPFDTSAGGFLNSGTTPDIFTNPGNINADTGGDVITDPGSMTDWTDPTFGGLFGWADGGTVPAPVLSLSGTKQAKGINPAALLAGGSNGTGSTGSSGGASGTDLAATLGSLGLGSGQGQGGGDSSGGDSTATSSSTSSNASSAVGNAVGSTVGHSVMNFALTALLAPILGPVSPFVSQLITKMLAPTPPAPNANTGTAPGSGPGVASNAVGSVSVGQPVGMAPDDGAAVGVTMGQPGQGVAASSDDGGSANTGDGNAAGSADGGVGDSGDGGDGGGYADGGMLPKQSNDKKGIRDTMMIPVSGGEYVMPADVMSKNPAMLPLMEFLRNSLHTPAAAQAPQ